MPQDALGQRKRGGNKLVVRNDFIDETKLQGALGRKRIAREQKLQSPLASSQPRQTLRAAKCWRDADINLRLCEQGGITRDGKVHNLGDLASAANAMPLTAAMIGFGKASRRDVSD